MANPFNRIERTETGTIEGGTFHTASGYWIQHRRHAGHGIDPFVVCWDTIRGTVGHRTFRTLLAARRFIEIADGEPDRVTTSEIEACHHV